MFEHWVHINKGNKSYGRDGELVMLRLAGVGGGGGNCGYSRSSSGGDQAGGWFEEDDC